MSHRITRNQYTSYYGPTAGSKIRLGDTGLVAEVERDSAVPGEECVFGGARSLRGAMGLSATRENALDCAIVNVVVIDWSGIYKSDIGIKNGRIVGIGKAGIPDIMSAVTPGMALGAGTQIISGEGLIATAGAVDCNCALDAPGLAESALSAGITTVLGGGAGHASEFESSAGTPGVRQIEIMLRAADALPLNVGLMARAGSPKPHALIEQIKAGAAGLNLSSAFGAAGAALDCALAVSIQFDLPIALEADAFNEAGGYDDLLAALQGRPLRLNLAEGQGGGPTPDALRVCGEHRILAASSSGSLPASVNTLDELRALLYARKRLDLRSAADAAFVESAVRGGTLAAEDALHDLGAIPIIASGSMNSGRLNDMLGRVWQTAHKMLKQRGRLPQERGQNDNLRIRRYLAKYTINPALACGIAHETGSLEVGKLADVVLWKPAFFGRRPECVIKGGMLAWSQSGVSGAALPRVQPVAARANFGALASSIPDCCVTFVSKLSLREKTIEGLGLKKPLAAVKQWRGIAKQEMKFNHAEPRMALDLHNFAVLADSEIVSSAPPENLPLAQRYALF